MSGPNWEMVHADFSLAARRIGAPDWGNIEQAFRDAAGHIDHMAQVAMQGMDLERHSLYAVVYRLVPFKDGDKWCVMLGDNLQEGIAGFGDTPDAAIWDFEKAMTRSPTNG